MYVCCGVELVWEVRKRGIDGESYSIHFEVREKGKRELRTSTCIGMSNMRFIIDIIYRCCNLKRTLSIIKGCTW